MRKPTFAAGAAVVVAAALSMPSALQAHDTGSGHGEGGSMMGPGMGNMGQMMDHCSRMMQGASGKPNEQWREGTPPAGNQNEKQR